MLGFLQHMQSENWGGRSNHQSLGKHQNNFLHWGQGGAIYQDLTLVLLLNGIVFRKHWVRGARADELRLQQCICISEAVKIIIWELIVTCVSYYLQQRKSNIIDAGQLEITVAKMGGAQNGKNGWSWCLTYSFWVCKKGSSNCFTVFWEFGLRISKCCQFCYKIYDNW